MGKPEGKVEDYLIRKSHEHGFFCCKFVSPGQGGVPDRIVIGRGHVAFLELKTEKGKPSPLQTATIRKMRAAGADVRILYGRKDVDQFFRETETWQENAANGKGNVT